MKILSTILTLLFTVSGLCASVDPYDVVVREDRTSETIVMRTTVPFSHDTKLQLLDGNDFAIYSRSFTAGSFLNKRILRSDFLNGNYTLVIADETGRTEIPLHLSRKGISYDAGEGRQLTFPRVDMSKERLLVLNYNNESGKRVNVSLTNEDGQQVFNEQLEGEGIRRSYQLDQLEAGNYTVTVTSRSVMNYTAAIALQ